MNMIDYHSGGVQLIHFVREKGKRVPKVLADGKIARDNRGKIVMVREKGFPRGILVAGMVDGNVRIGWSYTNKKLGDKFNKMRGMNIAVGRMFTPSHCIVPHKVLKEISTNFRPRVERHFNMSVS